MHQNEIPPGTRYLLILKALARREQGSADLFFRSAVLRGARRESRGPTTQARATVLATARLRLLSV